MSFGNALCVLVLALLPLLVSTQDEDAAKGRPNIVFILTDDQDKKLDSLQNMTTVQSELIAKGIEYDRHYCQVSLCCPSRVTLLTGRAAHNTKVTDLVMPFGQSSSLLVLQVCSKWPRRVPEVHQPRAERQMAGTDAPECWLQYLLHGQAYERS